MKRWIFYAFVAAATACGSAPEKSDSPAPTLHAQTVAPVADERPEFVVVDMTTRLYYAPDLESKFVQYRTPDEQSEVEEELREDALERARSLQERFEKEIEREEKRMKRMKDAEKRDEYALKRRERRARRFLKFQRRRAKRSRELPPESRFLVLEKVDETDEWLRVRTLTRSEEMRHCYSGGLHALGAMNLDFWIRDEDARKVIRRRERVGLWRGTEVKLAPGVVIEESGDKRYALVDGYRIEVKSLDEDAVARSYRAPQLFGTPVTDTQFSDVALAEGLLRLNDDQFLPYNPYQNLYVTATMWVGSRFYATTRTHCGEYTVLTSEDELRPAGRRKALRIQGEPPSPDPPFIRSGTEVFTREGKPLGLISRDLAVPKDLESVDGRQCSTSWIWKKRKKKKDEARRVEWCVDKDAIQRE